MPGPPLGDLVAMVAPDHEDGADSGLDATLDSAVGEAGERLPLGRRRARCGGGVIGSAHRA